MALLNVFVAGAVNGVKVGFVKLATGGAVGRVIVFEDVLLFVGLVSEEIVGAVNVRVGTVYVISEISIGVKVSVGRSGGSNRVNSADTGLVCVSSAATGIVISENPVKAGGSRPSTSELKEACNVLAFKTAASPTATSASILVSTIAPAEVAAE